MADEGYSPSSTLKRIADALQVNPVEFLAGDGGTQAACETLELLNAFQSIVNPEDRRICLNFIKSVAAQRQPIGAG
jgi:hypothetical protein